MSREIRKIERVCELYDAGFYLYERPQVCDDFQKLNEIENSKNLVSKIERICELYDAGLYIGERSQICDDFQKSNEIENSENLVSKFDIRAGEGMFFGTIISISIWVLIISFIIWVIS